MKKQQQSSSQLIVMMLTRTKFSPQIFPFLTYRSSPTSSVSVRHYSQQNEDDSSSNNNSSNKSLNLSFQGVIPKLLALEKGLISSGTGRKEYIELQKRGIFSTTFQGLVLYSHLQNPLLKKYAFDLSDFFEGAKESFKLIRNLSASKDFVEYSIGKPVTSVIECYYEYHIDNIFKCIKKMRLSNTDPRVC